MKKQILRKVLSVSMCALMLGGTAVTLPASVSGSVTGITANAADTETPASSFTYEENNEGGITITKFTGSETSVVIPSTINGKPVKIIGSKAFENCEKLTSITIPDSVTSIGDFAFVACTGLTSITIPKSVTSIGLYPFASCNGLMNIFVNSNNLVYSSSGGVLFNKNKSELLICPAGKSGSYTISDSVKSIGNGAFEGCTELTSITIPDSVTSIDETAFFFCTGLTNIKIPDSVTSIGEYAFYACTGLTSVKIPDSVTSSIGDYAFYNCSGLTSVTIGNSVPSIGQRAFEGCSGLTNVTIGNSVKTIDNYTFYHCTGLKSLTIHDSVKYIGYRAFGGCIGLSSLKIPDSVTSIGGDAFINCTGLTSITIPDSVTSIGASAFKGCTGLKSITIPDKLTSIEEYVFYGCTGLESITIPDSVTIISYSAFAGCTGLTNVTIGNSVQYIKDDAFLGCIGLTSFNVDNKNSYFSSSDGVLFDKSKTKLLFFPSGRKNNYIIPNSVTSIGGLAFYYCTGLKSITIPDSVTNIGSYAFYGCTGLTSITIPDSVNSIGFKVFDYTAWYNSQPDGLVYAGKVAYKYKGKMPSGTKIDLKNSTNGIADEAFYGCTGLTSITIPDSVTTIGTGAFKGCTGLTSITIPDRVTSILYSTFSGCTGLTSITIPDSVTSIDRGAFSSYKNLTIYGTKGSAASKYAYWYDINFIEIGGTLKNESTISSVTTDVNNTVTLKAKATGGYPTYTYTYRCKKTDAASWKYLATNTTTATLSYKPASTGTYDVQVIVKDSKGKTVTKGFKLTVKDAPLTNNSTISATSTTTDKAVTLTAKATGGKTPYTYTYRTKVSTSSTWTYLATNIKSTTFSFTPSKAATYDVQVIVKDADGKTVTKGFKLNVTAPLANNSTISATSTTVGKAVKLTAKATGGTSPYTYTFRCKKTDATSWKYLAANTTTATLSYKPASAGTYDIQVIVKDADGKTVTKGFSLTVKAAPLTNNSTISATSTTIGNSVTLTAKATGGKTPYTYTFRCKKADATSWKYLATNTTTATLNYKPASKGTYDVQVIVKDADGKTVTKGFKLTVK